MPITPFSTRGRLRSSSVSRTARRNVIHRPGPALVHSLVGRRFPPVFKDTSKSAPAPVPVCFGRSRRHGNAGRGRQRPIRPRMSTGLYDSMSSEMLVIALKIDKLSKLGNPARAACPPLSHQCTFMCNEVTRGSQLAALCPGKDHDMTPLKRCRMTGAWRSIQCGFDLRAKDHDSVCPECGRPVAEPVEAQVEPPRQNGRSSRPMNCNSLFQFEFKRDHDRCINRLTIARGRLETRLTRRRQRCLIEP